jgi:hypothetical protein
MLFWIDLIMIYIIINLKQISLYDFAKEELEVIISEEEQKPKGFH